MLHLSCILTDARRSIDRGGRFVVFDADPTAPDQIMTSRPELDAFVDELNAWRRRMRQEPLIW